MTSYVDNTLIENETVLYRARVSVWTLFTPLFLGVVALAIDVVLTYSFWGTIKTNNYELISDVLVLVIALIFFLVAYVRYSTTEFAVTDKRIIAKTGLVSRRTVEMFLDKVESLNVTQSTMGRLLNYGTVDIRGTGSTDEVVRDISGPLTLRKYFMAAADKYRTKV